MLNRSLLFVPGTRPERFPKALAAGADLVCLDLEDAVPAADKDRARTQVIDFLSEVDATGTQALPRVGLRINALDTRAGLADALALIDAGVHAAFVMLPKVENAAAVIQAARLLPAAGQVLPIVETAAGVANARQILQAEGVGLALFGGVDYVADARVANSWEGLLWARSHLANAARASDVTLFDMPYTNVRDIDGLAGDTRRAREIGLQARAAIHPDQVPVIHLALAPDAAELAAAQRIVDAFAAASGGAALLDGKLIELPVIKAARQTLALAAALPGSDNTGPDSGPDGTGS